MVKAGVGNAFTKRKAEVGKAWVIGQKVCVTNPNKLENL